jgi:hypothetical protein
MRVARIALSRLIFETESKPLWKSEIGRFQLQYILIYSNSRIAEAEGIAYFRFQAFVRNSQKRFGLLCATARRQSFLSR